MSKQSQSGSSDQNSNYSNMFFGIAVKREYGFWQFMTIPILSTANIMVGVYLNAQLAFMLEDKKMFAIPPE